MAKKYYAVRKGNQIGVVRTWAECQQMTSGFSGAEFRGFQTEEEAWAYIRGDEVAVNTQTGQKVNINKPTDDNTVNIYSDGAYKDGNVAFGICLETNKKMFQFYGLVPCGQYVSIANVAGELFGVLAGIQLAKDMGFTNLNIIYDYAGIEQWYTGAWKANGELQSIYISLMNTLRLQNNLTYTFWHVKGHSGVNGNVVADRMATRAINFKAYVDMNAILQGILTVKDVPLFA